MYFSPTLLFITVPLATVYADATAQSSFVNNNQALTVPGTPGAVGPMGSVPASSQQQKPEEVGYAPPQMNIAAQQYAANKDKYAAEVAKVMDRQNSFASESLELGEIDFDASSDSKDPSSESDESSSGSSNLSAYMFYLLTATLTAFL